MIRLDGLPTVLTTTLLLAACQAESPELRSDGPVSLGICGPVDPAEGVQVRDSAGVEIVENLAPVWNEGDAIAVGESPLAVIGARESDPDDIIGRLASALLLSDGRVVVADAQSLEIRIHAPDGAFIHRFGGRGEGPGEFERSVAVHRYEGDTLVVAHQGGRAYARMSPDGTYLDGGSLELNREEEPLGYMILDAFRSGDLLVNDIRWARPSEPETRVSRGTWRSVRRLDPRTGATDSIGPVPRDDHYIFLHTGEFEGWLTFGDVPFGRVESWTSGEGALFVGWGDHFQVDHRSADGELTRLIRLCEDTEPADPEELERGVEERLADLDPDDERREREALEGIPLPDTEPAHLEMLVDHAGRLWVRDFTPPWEEQIWRIFDRTGRWLGSATTPGRERVHDVGTDRLLTVGETELGVETVRVYPIVGHRDRAGMDTGPGRR